MAPATSPWLTPTTDTAVGWLPCPLVEWDHLYSALLPGQEPTRQRARTLKKNLRMSTGVKVNQRGDRGMSGASSYHSVLSVWADRARERGYHDDADRLTAAASELEGRFADQLRNFLTHKPFAALASADFFWRLTRDTVDVLATSAAWQESVVAFATVTDVDPFFAHLSGCAMDGTDRSVDLPRGLLARNNLDVGSHVYVLTHMLGNGAMVEVEPAVPVPDMWMTGLEAAGFPCGYVGDVKTAKTTIRTTAKTSKAAGSADPARDYERGAGSRITADQVALAREAARRADVKPRTLRPAG